jgi:thiol-disulfide isomerase/thioredoxin
MSTRILFPIVSILVLISCSGTRDKSDFELTGNFSNAGGETLYLEKLASNEPVVVDSAVIDEKGDFAFTNYKPRIGFYRIVADRNNFAMLVLDSADKLKLTGNIKDLGNTYKVEGSPETALFLEYNELAKTRDTRLDSLNKRFQAAMEERKMDSLRMDSLSAVFRPPFDAIVNDANARMAELIRRNTSMYSSIMAVQALESDQYPDVYRALDSGLTKKFPEDRNVRRFHEMVVKVLATRIGQLAPEINLPTPEGNQFSLGALRGKIVLIDFWASWCGPCRKEMPTVVKAYERYKNKGFEILGVSLDQERERWVDAIKADGMTWPQVSDLKQFGSEAARLYNVQAIPYTVLLDRDGKIIAKNLRGQELSNKLSEIFK